MQEISPFLATSETTKKVSSENPKHAGRKGQDLLAYLKTFLLAPVLRVEQCAFEKKEECCPHAAMGRIHRVSREMLSQIEWYNPQFSYHFKLIYALRTTIERLIGCMKFRFKMRHLYKQGIANIRWHILKL